jgi:hypothetical protein
MKKLIPGVLVCLAFVTFTIAGKESDPTFSKDVAPILYKSCVECHRPTGVAPMSLISYKEARPWAKAVKERVLDRTMPPWFADPAHGEFANNPSLSPAEVSTIAKWADAGAPKGDDKDLPPAPKFVEGWEIGTPDLVLSMKEEYSVPADGVVGGTTVTCPVHNWRVCLETGLVIKPCVEGTPQVRTFPVEVRDGIVMLRLDESKAAA